MQGKEIKVSDRIEAKPVIGEPGKLEITKHKVESEESKVKDVKDKDMVKELSTIIDKVIIVSLIRIKNFVIDKGM